MVDIRWDDHRSPRYLITHQLRRDPLAASYILHLLGDDAFAGIVHLGKVRVSRFRSLFAAFGDPLCARRGNRIAINVNRISVARSSAVTVLRRHKDNLSW